MEFEKQLPTYLEAQVPSQTNDKGIEIVTLELNRLPKHMDETEIKKAFFSTHLVKFDTHKDNITGVYTGKGRVQIRCHDAQASEKTNELIESLATRGIQAQVKSQRKVKELVDLTNEVLL
jgi:hypothetical protein